VLSAIPAERAAIVLLDGDPPQPVIRARRSREGAGQIEHVSEALESEAWSWLRRHDERVYSFVDATSFAVMRRRRIREALAFDGDFRAAGFVELRPAGR